MSFDLRIRFSGLMMWVPEGDTAMHVLMPDANAHEPHYARLVYDAAYEDEDAEQLSREYVAWELRHSLLDLAALSSPDGIDVYLPDELPSLIPPITKHVEQTFVHGLPMGSLVARVSMDAGAVTDYEMGVPFRFPSDTLQRITPSTEWTIRNCTSPERGGADVLGGLFIQTPDGREELPDLFPIGHTIHLMVMHATASQSLPHHSRYNPEPSTDDTHFPAYYQIATPYSNDPPLPRRARLPKPYVRGAEVPEPKGQPVSPAHHGDQGDSGQFEGDEHPARVESEDRERHRPDRPGILVPSSICGQAKASLG